MSQVSFTLDSTALDGELLAAADQIEGLFPQAGRGVANAIGTAIRGIDEAPKYDVTVTRDDSQPFSLTITGTGVPAA